MKTSAQLWVKKSKGGTRNDPRVTEGQQPNKGHKKSFSGGETGIIDMKGI